MKHKTHNTLSSIYDENVNKSNRKLNTGNDIECNDNDILESSKSKRF